MDNNDPLMWRQSFENFIKREFLIITYSKN